MLRQIWIGLVNVVPLPGNFDLGGGRGAFVNAIAFADSIASYCDLVGSYLARCGYECIEFEDVEPLAERKKNFVLSPDLESVFRSVEAFGDVGLGIFHSYDAVDDLD